MTRIMVVDDEAGVRRSLKKVLEPDGYTVILAENGRQAINIINHNVHDIETVISDYRMPGMDGISTLIAIGQINTEITRIILTGYATMESAIEAVNVGIDGFITKPFDNVELKAKLREYNIKKRLKQFVSEQVLKMLYRQGGQISPKRQTVSVLFSDIRGFSALAHGMEPEKLADMINMYYFTPLDNIIFAYNGTLDKHIGDGIMGVFGAPISSSDHAERALSCALTMMNEMVRINDKCRLMGFEIAIGIGISTGDVISGFYGSPHKKEFTVFGTPVNWAARLEHYAKKGQILFCEETYRQIRDSVIAEKIKPVCITRDDRNYNAYAIDSL